jgi:hypothetical protein
MTMTKDEFRPLLLVLAKGCRVEFDREQCSVWFAALCDLPVDDAASGIARFVCEIGKWPDIATVRRLAVESIHGQTKPWTQALEEIRQAVRRFGLYGQADAQRLLDARTWQTVKALGGWRRLCDLPCDRSTTLTAQFRDIYQDISDRSDKRRALPIEIRPTLVGTTPVDANDRRTSSGLLSLLTKSFSRVLNHDGE